jgi:Myb-like DNA-binding domain
LPLRKPGPVRVGYTRFSDPEHMMLFAGVRRFGAGKWKLILAAYPFNARRSPVDLKDKWRNVLKKEKRRSRGGEQQLHTELLLFVEKNAEQDAVHAAACTGLAPEIESSVSRNVAVNSESSSAMFKELSVQEQQRQQRKAQDNSSPMHLSSLLS